MEEEEEKEMWGSLSEQLDNGGRAAALVASRCLERTQTQATWPLFSFFHQSFTFPADGTLSLREKP